MLLPEALVAQTLPEASAAMPAGAARPPPDRRQTAASEH
jgi:hypothetical protein